MAEGRRASGRGSQAKVTPEENNLRQESRRLKREKEKDARHLSLLAAVLLVKNQSLDGSLLTDLVEMADRLHSAAKAYLDSK